MIKNLCSIFILKTSNSLIFSMIKHPPLYDAGRGILHSQNRAAKVLQISQIYKYLLDFL